MSVLSQPFESPEMRAMIEERDAAVAALADGIAGQVSVCVPCYQQSQYLEDALRSVAAQTVAPLETIVIDDGSDATHAAAIRDLCERYGARYVRVTNRGLPNARNTGLQLARGEAFLPLDADDRIAPEYIERTLPLLLAGADVVVPGLQEHGPTRNGTYMPGYDRPLEQVTLDVMWEFNRTFYASLFRTRLLREVGGYNGRMLDGFEDYDLAIDLMTRGARYVACNEVLFHYTTRPDSMLSSAMGKQAEIMAEMRRHHA